MNRFGILDLFNTFLAKYVVEGKYGEKARNQLNWTRHECDSIVVIFISFDQILRSAKGMWLISDDAEGELNTLVKVNIHRLQKCVSVVLGVICLIIYPVFLINVSGLGPAKKNLLH